MWEKIDLPLEVISGVYIFSLRNDSVWETLILREHWKNDDPSLKFIPLLFAHPSPPFLFSLLSTYEFTEMEMPSWLDVPADLLENKGGSEYNWKGCLDNHKSLRKHKINSTIKVPTSTATQTRNRWIPASGVEKALSTFSGFCVSGKVLIGELRYL